MKAEREAAEEKYCWATIDGRREKVGNYRVEPPVCSAGAASTPRWVA